MSNATTPAASEQLPRFLTVQQAADELATSRSHIYRMVDAGEIPFKRIGRTVRIPRSWILSLDCSD